LNNKSAVALNFGVNSRNDDPCNIVEPGIVVTENKHFFHILPVQQWWLEDKIDFEFKQRVFFSSFFSINGNFQPDIFRSALKFVLERHESLRAFYRKIAGEYMMAFLEADPDLFFTCIEWDDKRSEDDIARFFYFKDHQFNVMTGPLFFVRLVARADDEFWLSLKGHHSIMDGWSVDVLFRDIMLFYEGISLNGDRFSVPALPAQYQNYIAVLNRHRKLFAETDMQHWNLKYSQLPPKMFFCGESDNALLPAEFQTSFISIPKRTYTTLTRVAGQQAASLFVVLQATVSSFLANLTGICDVIYGTQTFGRSNLPKDIENQIGCYVQTTLIRVILNNTDSFSSCIKKVKEANDDMRKYTACNLLEWVESKMMPGEKLSSFWKLSVHYMDSGGYLQLEDSGRPFTIDVMASPYPEQLNLNMKLEFHRMDDEIVMKLTYNGKAYPHHFGESFVNSYVQWLDKLERECYSDSSIFNQMAPECQLTYSNT
jgi:hypothetical protein